MTPKSERGNNITVRPYADGYNQNADVMPLGNGMFRVFLYTRTETVQYDVGAKTPAAAIEAAWAKLKAEPRKPMNVPLTKIAGFAVKTDRYKWTVFLTRLKKEYHVEARDVIEAEEKALASLRAEREAERKRAARGW